MASTSHLPNILPRVVVTIVDDFLSKTLYTHSGYEDINLKTVSYARHFLERKQITTVVHQKSSSFIHRLAVIYIEFSGVKI